MAGVGISRPSVGEQALSNANPIRPEYSPLIQCLMRLPHTAEPPAVSYGRASCCPRPAAALFTVEDRIIKVTATVGFAIANIPD